MSIPRFGIGDLVVGNPDFLAPAVCDKTYKIVDRLRVNVVLEPIGGGRRVRVNPAYLLPAPADSEIPAAIMVPYRAALAAGAVVTVAGPGWRGAPGLYAVLDDNSDRTKVAILGGDPQKPYRYWKIPSSWVSEVDRDALLAAVSGLPGAAR